MYNIILNYDNFLLSNYNHLYFLYTAEIFDLSNQQFSDKKLIVHALQVIKYS